MAGGNTSLSELLQYPGNPGLAGGTGTGGTFGVADFGRALDAVDRFTAYTMQVNRDMWVDNNLKMQQQAVEAAKQLSVEYGDLIPEDRTQVDDAVQELYDFYQKNPNSLVYRVDPKDPNKNNSKEYNKFLTIRQKLDRLIVRGNIRAQQLSNIDKTRSSITDPSKLRQYDQLVLNERQKPIEENLLIPPDIAPFNWSAYIDGKSQVGQRQYEYIQRFPNDILTATKNLFDPFQASAGVANDMNSSTPLSEDLKKNLALQFVAINQVLDRHRVPDGQGGTRLDTAALQADPDAKPFMAQISQFNQHVQALNNTDLVEGGKKTNMKVRQFLGYNQDLPQIDVNNLNEMDLVRMAMTYKMGVNTVVKAQPTDNAIQTRGQDLTFAAEMARLKQQREQFWFNVNQGKQQENNIADEKILTYYNLMNTPESQKPEDQVVETVRKNGQVATQRPIGYEVAVTPQLSQAFAIPTDKTKTTDKNTAGAGSFTNQSYTQTVNEQNAKRPYRIFVVPGADGDKNKNSVNVRYEDGSVKEFTGSQVFTMMNKIFGDDDKIQSKVSEVSMRRLAGWGLSQPDVRAIEKQLGNIGQQQDIQDMTKPPQATKVQTQKKPRPY
jgi:hypothetical protein